jgi:hypothetical protein
MCTRSLKLEIRCNNAAFEDDAGAEIARILRKLATDVEGLIRYTAKGTYTGALRDINGHTVGHWAQSIDGTFEEMAR